MPETRNRRRSPGRNAARQEAVATEGLIGRLVDHACDNPAVTGGLFVMALTASAIISNAMFLQSVRHPGPLFATRPPLIVERHAPSASLPPPLPPQRDDQSAAIPRPVPRPSPISATTPIQPSDAGLVREIQAVLARKGLYLGSVDGEYGPLSQSAISTYQKAEGLPVTGEPSAALLEHLKMQDAATQPGAEAAKLPAVESTVANSERLKYERVQTALNLIGYGPVSVDGEANKETVNAIRRFELDNGLPVSGTASDAVIDRLIAIGALPAT